VPRYNAALRAWGLANHVPVVDAQHYFEQLPSDLFSDECHFTPHGYERMARMVRDELDPEKLDSNGGERRQAEGQKRETRQR
jgi:lysophospholipase L1-like esterase